MSYDVLVIGGGPAGLSASINVRARGRSALVVSNPLEENPLWRAEKVDNYLGLPGLSGAEMLAAMRRHAEQAGVEFLAGKVLNAVQMPDAWYVSVGPDMYNARAVVLAAGVARGKKFAGEAELLGRGVSYCATCDAHFYKGKAVAVLGYNAESCREADFLAETCARVLYFPVVPHEVNVGPNVTVVRERVLSIPGTMRAEGVQTDKDLHPVDGVFVLRDAVAPDKLVPGLATDGPHVAVDAQMRTNLPGCFACGDLAGKPYQYIKAAGQGNIAALSAVEWLAEQK